jgi:hypothetical protein
LLHASGDGACGAVIVLEVRANGFAAPWSCAPMKFRVSAFLIFGLLTAASASAQTEEKKRDRSGGYSAIVDNIDMLIDNYARFLGRKYDLNEEQDQYTKQLIRERAYGFLERHEDKLRGLFDELFDARAGGNIDQDSLIAWGKSAMPIFEDAKKIVTEGNDEWAKVLTDAQQKIHAEDLKQMQDSFASTEQMLTRIVSGEMTVEEFRNPRFGARSNRRANPQVARPAEDGTTQAQEEQGADAGGAARVDSPKVIRPAKRFVKNAETGGDAGESGKAPENAPAPGEAPPGVVVQPAGDTEQPIVAPPHQPQPQPQPENEVAPPQPKRNEPAAKPPGRNYETEWERYVREFIDKYKLDESQTQKAETFLKDCETQADKYLTGRRSEMESLDKRENELKTPPKGKEVDAAKAGERSKELSEIAKKRTDLMKPIGDIFENSLKPRLEKLPTRAQRKAADDAAAKSATPAKAGKSGAAGKSAKPEAKPEAKAEPKPAAEKPAEGEKKP